MRVRFAPDARATLNIMGVRIALINWLLARKLQGSFVLRIEDRDPSREARVDRLLSDLEWLGLDWDEGPKVGGDFGPYYQSERLDIYADYMERLRKMGHVYPCYCTPEELAAKSREAREKGQAPLYDGRCRNLSAEKQKELEAKGTRCALRLRVPSEGTTKIKDVIRGSVEVENRHLDDYMVRRRDGVYTYNYCCVIDDHLMKIDRVVRGEEHLVNTPRQLWLYDALGIEPPEFLHLGKLVGPSGAKLRTAHPSTSVEDLRRRGVVPEVLLKYMASLDGMHISTREPRKEMIGVFSPRSLSPEPITYRRRVLYKENAHYLRSLPTSWLARLAEPYMEVAGIWPHPERDERWLRDAVDLVRDETVLLFDIPHHLSPLLQGHPRVESGQVNQMLNASTAVPVLQAWVEELSNVGSVERLNLIPLATRIRKELGVSARDVFMPLRVALTGRLFGPQIERIISLLGREEVIERLLRAYRQMT